MKLESWKEDFKGRLGTLGIVSVEVSNEEEDESNFLGSFEEECEWGSEGGKESSELMFWMKDLDPLLFLKIVSTLLSSNSILKILSLSFGLTIFFWKSSNSSCSVSSEVKIADTGNFDESRWNWIED